MKEKYPKDIFSGLWKRIDELCKNERLIAPIEVKKEIEKGDDELKKWARDKLRKRMFKKPDKNQVEKVQETLKNYPFLSKSDKPDEPNADPWLIALAIVKNEEERGKFEHMRNKYIVISEESPTKPNRIPAVCRNFGIECISLIDFFRREGWKF